MALVGTIEAGKLTELLDSIAEGKASMLVICDRGAFRGRIVCQDGVITRSYIVSRDEGGIVFSGDQALEELKGWREGVFSLLRWGAFEPLGGPRVLVVADGDSEGLLEQRLADEGFETRVVLRHDEVAELARILEPQAVVISCPRAATGHTCEEIRASIAAASEGGKAPVLITRVDPDEQALCPHRAAKISAEAAGKADPEDAPSAFCRAAPAPMDEILRIIKDSLE